jgi:hypothetical protein
MKVVTEPKILATAESNSKPGTYHEIRLGKDGVVYCTCWAWRINKWCKHLDEYHSKNQTSRSVKPVSIAIAQNEVDKVIKSIGGGTWD